MKTKRYTVTLTKNIDAMLREVEMGSTTSEKIRNIVMAWMAEKSIISTEAKAKLKRRRKS